MKKRKISKSSLAKKLGKSRSAVSQMFNKTPNITIKKMVLVTRYFVCRSIVVISAVPVLHILKKAIRI